ncbi:MAG: phage major capsid protein [Vicinamibacterales bacterium]
MTFTLVPFLVALLVGLELTNGFHASYKVAERQTGFTKIAPWLQRTSTALACAPSAWVAGVLSFMRARPQLIAAALVMAVALAHPASGEPFAGVALIGIAGTLNLAQLETDVKAKQAAAKDLLEKTMRACADHVVTAATATAPEVKGRLMTAEEKAAIQAILDEGKALKSKIDGLQGDANFQAEIDRLTAGMTAAAHDGNRARERRSIGQQFVADPAYRAWVKGGQHKRLGSLSPGVEILGATLTEDAASGGDLIVPDVRPGIIPLLFRRLVVADLIAPGTTESNLVQFMKETTFTNAADAVAEGGLKPESTLIFDAATSAVRKIAHWIPVTEEMLEDFAQTASIIDARLKLGLDLKEEDELLNGSGVAPHLLGLMTLPGLSAAVARGADSNMDAIFKQMTAIATTVFVLVDGIVINPANWQAIQLLKNAAGNYMGSGPWAAAQTPILWGVPAAVTPSIVANTALVGAFRSCAQVFRKGGDRVESSNSHASFFVNNLVAIRAERRLALAAYREAAFGKVTGLN